MHTTFMAFHPVYVQKNVPTHALVMIPMQYDMQQDDRWDYSVHHTP